MTDTTPTLADMAATVDLAADAYETRSGSPMPTLRATAALLRRLSDPSEEMLERMAVAAEGVRHGFALTGCMDSMARNERDAMRAALTELLTGEASDENA